MPDLDALLENSGVYDHRLNIRLEPVMILGDDTARFQKGGLQRLF